MAKELIMGCNNEFPHFGAYYPDAHCINGYLYDMDSTDENGCYTIGGDDPCPFCNVEKWLDSVVGWHFKTKDEALLWRTNMIEKWCIKL